MRAEKAAFPQQFHPVVFNDRLIYHSIRRSNRLLHKNLGLYEFTSQTLGKTIRMLKNTCYYKIL